MRKSFLLAFCSICLLRFEFIVPTTDLSFEYL